jgi:hypothetical protein
MLPRHAFSFTLSHSERPLRPFFLHCRKHIYAATERFYLLGTVRGDDGSVETDDVCIVTPAITLGAHAEYSKKGGCRDGMHGDLSHAVEAASVPSTCRALSKLHMRVSCMQANAVTLPDAQAVSPIPNSYAGDDWTVDVHVEEVLPAGQRPFVIPCAQPLAVHPPLDPETKSMIENVPVAALLIASSKTGEHVSQLGKQ